MEQLLAGSVKPEWEEIETAVNSCSNKLKQESYDNDTVDAIAMILESLMENAMKYGAFHRHEDNVTYSIAKSGDTLTIETRNYIEDGHDQDVKKLDERIQWIRGYQNPFEAYIERLKEVSSRPFKDKESGMGLVRMAYEGQAILDFFVDAENIISVSAIYQL